MMNSIKKRYILLFIFVITVFLTAIIGSSILFRPYTTHMIVRPINCFSCHATELKDLAIGNHIRAMDEKQNKILYDYLNIYGNASSDNYKSIYSLQGPCYSCHITYGNFDQFGLTDPYAFFRSGSDNNVVDARYGYIIVWNGTNSTKYINDTPNASIHVELEVLDTSPENFTVDTTVKMALANYSGQQTGNTIFDSNAILSKGDTMVIDVTNFSEDYFKIILILDGLWNNTLLNLRINDTDKGLESFFIIANSHPFVYEAPLNATGVYYFKTNGTYKAIRLDYVWSEWANYSLGDVTSSELIKTSDLINGSSGSNSVNLTNGININSSTNITWKGDYTCSSPGAMCHIVQKTTSMGLSNGMNPDKSLYSHDMEFVTSTQCKLCHLKNRYITIITP